MNDGRFWTIKDSVSVFNCDIRRSSGTIPSSYTLIRFENNEKHFKLSNGSYEKINTIIVTS